MTSYAFVSNNVRVAFSTSPTASPQESDGWFAVTFDAPPLLDPTRVSKTSACYASRGNACKDYDRFPLGIFMDPPNTVIDVGDDNKQQQASLMNKWCAGGSGGPATCDYTVTDITNLQPDFTNKSQPGGDAYNKSAGTSKQVFTYTLAESATTSWEISSEVSGAIAKVVTVKLAGKTGQSWTTSATVTKSLEQPLRPWSYTVVEAAPFLSDVRGDLKITMYNTTWNLKDVVYTYPTAGKFSTDSYVIRQEPLDEGFLIKDPKSDTPFEPIYAIGDRKQLQVTAFNGSGTFEDKTKDASYTSSDPTVATVSETGVVEAKAAGTTKITANYSWQINTISETLTKTMTVTVK
jgi:hypothetical protein